MASRQEEKERLRREREEAERVAAAGAGRRRRLGLILGGLLALAVVAIVVAALASGGDGGGGGENGGGVKPPPQTVTTLEEAAKAGDCTFRELPDEGNEHLRNRSDTVDDYGSNPPTSGRHHEPPAPADGIYAPGRSPVKEDWVHSLEHGRVIFMYAPGTPERLRKQLEALMDEEFNDKPAGYKTIVMENNTDMPFAVAAVAWTRYVGCKRFTERSFDALRTFRSEFVEDEAAPEADFPWPAE